MSKEKSKCGECGLEFEYRPSQSKGNWCSNKCQMNNQYKQYIERWKTGLENGGKAKGIGFEVSSHVRRYLHESMNSKCSKCGWGETNQKSGKVPLHIDHIDGNSTNHSIENLRLLCPNCHSLTETYGSLNTKPGRYKMVPYKGSHPKYIGK